MTMKILLIEPYFSGSHAAWAKGYAQHSRHQVEILSLPGRFWKWRMHGGAVTLARRFATISPPPDLILATDMLDLSSFVALTGTQIPTALYFHENQLTYPWSPTDRDVARKRDKHYGFINYISALVADAVFFNSRYHQESFLTALPRLLKHFPDYNELGTVAQIRAKSQLLPVGLNLHRFDAVPPAERQRRAQPLILWNHRWEYDKNPTEFFEALYMLAERDIPFELALLGENFSRQPQIFEAARQRLGARVVQFGFVKQFAAYARWLWQADILPVTSYQEFFGVSVVQAAYCNTMPLLPRRLTYPELFSAVEHAPLFYRDPADMVARLSALLTAPDQLAALRQTAWRTAIKQYDWQHQAPRYDDALQQLAPMDKR